MRFHKKIPKTFNHNKVKRYGKNKTKPRRLGFEINCTATVKNHTSAETSTQIQECPEDDPEKCKDFQRTPIISSSDESLINSSAFNSISADDTVRVLPRLQTPEVEIRVFSSRFWVLFLYGFFTFYICVQWDAWGPISDSMIAAFPGWDNATIALLENWTMLMNIICVLPVCWATGRLGLRVGMLISSVLTAVGLVLRCITYVTPIFTILSHVCSILVSLSGTLLLSAPTMLAAEWFPRKERTTATAVIMAMEPLGLVGSYLEPFFVREPDPGVSISSIRDDVMKMMYFYAAIGGVILIASLIYFPSRPPLPPSPSSRVKRLDFKEGLKQLLRNRNLLSLMVIYGLAAGPSIAWPGVLNFSLETLQFTQDEAMYVGLTAVLASTLATIASGILTDMIYGYIKETLILLLLLSASFYYWFLLISYGTISFIKWHVYMSVAGGMSLTNASIPLFFDLASEMAYPIPEVLVGGLFSLSDCIVSTIFLFVFMAKNIGVLWVTLVLVASTGLPALGLVFIQDGYARSNYDRDSNISG